MQEIWYESPSFPRYAVSTLGRIINTQTDRIMKQTKNAHSGNAQVTLMREDGRSKTVLVHNVVSECFMPAPVYPDTSILHIDGDRMNCATDNLSWQPRWRVVQYMQYINAPWALTEKWIETEEGTRFLTIKEFCMASLALPRDAARALDGDELSFRHYGKIWYL